MRGPESQPESYVNTLRIHFLSLNGDAVYFGSCKSHVGTFKRGSTMIYFLEDNAHYLISIIHTCN